jgi:hypothetical protein
MKKKKSSPLGPAEPVGAAGQGLLDFRVVAELPDAELATFQQSLVDQVDELMAECLRRHAETDLAFKRKAGRLLAYDNTAEFMAVAIVSPPPTIALLVAYARLGMATTSEAFADLELGLRKSEQAE